MHDVILLLVNATMLCKIYSSCVNVIVFYFCVYIAQLLVGTVSFLCSGLLLLEFFLPAPHGKMLTSPLMPVCFVLSFCITDGEQSVAQCHFTINAALRKDCCVKMKVNFTEYNPNRGRLRARGSRFWRSTEVVFLCTLTIQ